MSATLELFDLIGELARRRYQLAERTFAAVGLNHTEARILSLLSAAGGASPQDSLSSQLLVDRTNAGRALTRLAEAGYLQRTKDTRDQRANLIQITAKGRKAVSAIAHLREQMAGIFFGDLTQREAASIVRLLQKRLPLPSTDANTSTPDSESA